MTDDEITLPPLPPHRLGERWPHQVVWGYEDMAAYARAAVLLDRQQRAAPPSLPWGWKVLRDTTRDERSWPEDEKLENGAYFNTCLRCLRQFVGHKRRRICRACDVAQPAPSAEPGSLTVDRTHPFHPPVKVG